MHCSKHLINHLSYSISWYQLRFLLHLEMCFAFISVQSICLRSGFVLPTILMRAANLLILFRDTIAKQCIEVCHSISWNLVGSKCDWCSLKPSFCQIIIFKECILKYECRMNSPPLMNQKTRKQFMINWSGKVKLLKWTSL